MFGGAVLYIKVVHTNTICGQLCLAAV